MSAVTNMAVVQNFEFIYSSSNMNKICTSLLEQVLPKKNTLLLSLLLLLLLLLLLHHQPPPCIQRVLVNY
jgi:hypothetical protein